MKKKFRGPFPHPVPPGQPGSRAEPLRIDDKALVACIKIASLTNSTPGKVMSDIVVDYIVIAELFKKMMLNAAVLAAITGPPPIPKDAPPPPEQGQSFEEFRESLRRLADPAYTPPDQREPMKEEGENVQGQLPPTT